MNEQDAFDQELENLEDALDKARQADMQLIDAQDSVRRRFAESALWLEHKRWHDEQGTEARLLVQEAEVPVTTEPTEPAQASETHLKMVRFGACQCQPFNPLLQLNDRGQVVAGIPASEEKATYGLSSGSATTEYAAGQPSASYQLDPSLSKDLYR